MKKYHELFKLATKLELRYAQSQSLQDTLANAASYGSKVHMMNFPEQLKKDQANMTITISKNGGTYTVSEPTLEPSSVTDNYMGLATQIKKYLEKYYSNLPNQNLTLQYSGVDSDGLARQ